MLNRFAAQLMLALLVCACASAETIKLSDGSTLKGTILSSDATGVHVLTSSGELTLKRSDITAVTIDRYTVTLKDGSVLNGEITDISETQVTLKTLAGTLSLRRDGILSIAQEGAKPAVTVSTATATVPPAQMAASTTTLSVPVSTTAATVPVAQISASTTALSVPVSTATAVVPPAPASAATVAPAAPVPAVTTSAVAPVTPAPAIAPAAAETILPQQMESILSEQQPQTAKPVALPVAQSKQQETPPSQQVSAPPEPEQKAQPTQDYAIDEKTGKRKRPQYPGNWEAGLGYMAKGSDLGSGIWGEMAYMVPAAKLGRMQLDAGAALGYGKADTVASSVNSGSLSLLPVEARLRLSMPASRKMNVFAVLGAGYCLANRDGDTATVTESADGSISFMAGAGVSAKVFSRATASLGIAKHFVSSDITRKTYSGGTLTDTSTVSLNLSPLVLIASLVLDF